MRCVTLMVCLGGLAGCPESAGTSTTTEATSSSATEGGVSTGVSSGTVPTNPLPAEGDTGSSQAWLEVGFGTAEFNAFEGLLPVVVGPQGLYMFSLPLRGRGFYNPPDPSFDNPDMPILQAWVEIDGYELTDQGRFNEVVDYPALFYPSGSEPGVLEGPAVWLVLPDGVDPEEIVGLDARLHAELVDVDGLVLVDEHQLVVDEIPPPPDGP